MLRTTDQQSSSLQNAFIHYASRPSMSFIPEAMRIKTLAFYEDIENILNNQIIRSIQDHGYTAKAEINYHPEVNGLIKRMYDVKVFSGSSQVYSFALKFSMGDDQTGKISFAMASYNRTEQNFANQSPDQQLQTLLSNISKAHNTKRSRPFYKRLLGL